MRTPLLTALGATTLAFVAGLATPASADTIFLKNGYKVDGWILEESESEVRLAIIRQGSVGTLIFSPTDIERIDRGREITLEEALKRERARIAAEERLRREAELAAAGTGAEGARRQGEAGSEPGSPEGAAAAEGAGGEPEAGSEHVPTKAEQEKIDELIEQMGDTRSAGGSGTRRANARDELASTYGTKALKSLTAALGDATNSYRRWGAAQAIGQIATRVNPADHPTLYMETVPALVARIQDDDGWVRRYANQALGDVSGLSFGQIDAQKDKPGPAEARLVQRWNEWWSRTEKVWQERIEAEKAKAEAEKAETPGS